MESGELALALKPMIIAQGDSGRRALRGEPIGCAAVPRTGRPLGGIGHVGGEERDPGMRFDGASVANGLPGGVCYREIDFLGAILRDPYVPMRSHRHLAQPSTP